MKEYYQIEVAGLKRQLPLCPLTDKLYIAGFVIFGDVDGDSKTATSDINEFEAYLTSSFALSEAQKKAMNLDNDSRKRLNSNDLVRLRAAVSAGKTINQVNPAQ